MLGTQANTRAETLATPGVVTDGGYAVGGNQHRPILLSLLRLLFFHMRHMPHDPPQLVRFRSQGCIQLREASPLSDQIACIQRFAAHHAGDAGLHSGRERLPLLRGFQQAPATRGFFLDERSRRCARIAGWGTKRFAARCANQFWSCGGVRHWVDDTPTAAGGKGLRSRDDRDGVTT